MTNEEKLIKLKNDKSTNKTKRDVLKRAMSGKYCNKTYFDFLDSEERLAIYQAMEEYASIARADEREKMTQEKFAEYFNSLKGGEVANAILTQLLRKGVTDDDLRGLRLQWIKDEREKMQGVDCWVSRDKEPRNSGVVMWALENKPRYDPEIDVWISSKNFNSRVVITGATGINFNLSPGQCKKFRIVEVI